MNLQNLQQQMGTAYDIQYIDGERCLHRRLINGFDIEISGCRRANEAKGKGVNVYLWHKGTDHDYLIVHHVLNVQLSQLGHVCDRMNDFAEWCTANNKTAWNYLYHVEESNPDFMSLHDFSTLFNE